MLACTLRLGGVRLFPALRTLRALGYTMVTTICGCQRMASMSDADHWLPSVPPLLATMVSSSMPYSAEQASAFRLQASTVSASFEARHDHRQFHIISAGTD